MKKAIFILSSCIVLCSFTLVETFKKSYGEVEQVEGYYIFVNAKPLTEYTFLGSVSAFTTWRINTHFIDIRNVLIKKAQKEYPKADALIFTFSDGEKNKCEAVMFK